MTSTLARLMRTMWKNDAESISIFENFLSRTATGTPYRMIRMVQGFRICRNPRSRTREEMRTVCTEKQKPIRYMGLLPDR